MAFVSRGLTWCLALGITFSAWGASRPSRRTTLPNLVIIVAEDLAVDELNGLPDRQLVTPHLDELNRQGFRFTQAYVGSPAGAAARASLLTGLAADQLKIRSQIQEPLAPDDITVAEVVRTVGYRTSLVGQWGLGWEGTTGHPNQQGFLEFLGSLDLQHGAYERTQFLWRNEFPFTLRPFPQARLDDLAASWLFRGVTNFVRLNEDLPFFLVFAPHLPGGGTLPTLPGEPAEFHYTNTTWTAAERSRAVRITRLDHQVGQLIAELQRRNLSGDTVVALTSVPAFEAVPAGSWNRLTGGAQGRSHRLSEADLRAPLVFWGPGRVRVGETNLPVAAWDLLPTLGEIAGAPLPGKLAGLSLWPLISATNGISTNRPPAPLYWESHGPVSGQAARLDFWKGLQWGPQKTLELYDLQTDPQERTNVISAHPEVANQFQGLFQARFRTWAPPNPGETNAPGRTGRTVPAIPFQQPMRTNLFPIGNSAVSP